MDTAVIDTVVSVPGRGLYVFSGDQVWRYTNHRAPDPGYPKPITAEFPGAFQRDLDAALMHPDGSLYLFRGSQHLRYNLAAGRPHLGYPRPYAPDWPGVFPDRIDAAITWTPDVIYLFRGAAYTSFSPRAARARHGYPKPLVGNWPGLPAGPVRAAFTVPGDRAEVLTSDARYLLDSEGRALPGTPTSLPAVLLARDLADRESQVAGPWRSAERVDQEAEAPPREYATMPLGLDISSHQGVASGKQVSPQPLATFQRLVRLGKDFVIVKASEWVADPTFRGHYENVRAAGLIRGTFHLFTPGHVSDQARLFLGLVPRVGPGELAPALDVEDSHMVLWPHYHYTHADEHGHVAGNAAGSTALLDDLQDWLDRVEAALGRTPIIYTGVIWRDDLRSTRMSQYPLWTLPNRWFPAGRLGGWRHVELWQYAEDGTPGYGMAKYREPGVELPGVDYDAYNGTIYGLRGLADLGRTGVGLTSLGTVIAHCEPDRHLHLARESPPRRWTDTDLMRGALPGLGGDPVLCTAGTSVQLYFRSDGRIVEATQADPAAAWDVEDLSSIAGVTAVHDPRALTVGDRRVVVFSGDDDDWHLLSRTTSTPWSVMHLLSAVRRSGTTSVPPSSGQPAVYLAPGSADPRIVGRVGPLGHLVELALGPAGWAATDLTATSTGPHGIPPAATYSPTVYHSAAETFVVYRAIRGELWQIARGARQATNLTSTVGAQIAAGHPTCFVLAGQAHVVYRGIDQRIHELLERNGTWSAAGLPCDVPAASDPTCPDDTAGLVTFRAMDGTVRILRFDGFTWTCTDTVRPATSAGAGSRPIPPPPEIPPAPGSSVFAALGAAAGRFRDLVAAGDERSAVSLAYQYKQRDVNAITDLVFFSRHRELGERRLRPDETALTQEWQMIRERVVGPAVAALAHGGPTAPTAAERSDEVRPEATRVTAEPRSTGEEWPRVVIAADAESGMAADGLRRTEGRKEGQILGRDGPDSVRTGVGPAPAAPSAGPADSHEAGSVAGDTLKSVRAAIARGDFSSPAEPRSPAGATSALPAFGYLNGLSPHEIVAVLHRLTRAERAQLWKHVADAARLFDLPRLRVALAVAGASQARAIKAVENLDALRNANPPSTVHTAFAAAAAASSWPAAWQALTELNMYEMVRALDAMGDTQRGKMWASKPTSDMSRAEYAKSVVENRQLPASAPGDPAGQPQEAADYVAEQLFHVAAAVNPDAMRHMSRLLQACTMHGINDKSHVAYVLASAHWESRMGEAMTEFASGSAYEGRADLCNTHPGDGVRYKGRGYVQITGRCNYQHYTDLLGIDLITHPERASEPAIAAQICADGMAYGRFTGRRLRQFGTDGGYDFASARQIVNGHDHAAAIAMIAQRYRAAMNRP